MAAIVLILAEDMQKNGLKVDAHGRVLKAAASGAGGTDAEDTSTNAAPKKAAPKKGGSRAAFMARTQACALTSATSTTTASGAHSIGA